MNKTILCILFSFLIAVLSYSQGNIKQSFNEATKSLFFNNYNEAMKYLSLSYKADPNNANVCYLIGYCLLHDPIYKEKSIPFFEKAIKDVAVDYVKEDYRERRAPVDVYLYIGVAYHFAMKFKKAREMFIKYGETATIDDPLRKDELEMYLAWCNNAPEVVKDSAEIEIINLGNIVNSKFDDHTPLVNSEENVLIFTSRRAGSTGNQLTDDGRYFEDIYISEKKNGQWTAPVQISNNINTAGHEATVALSPDAQNLIIYRDDFGIGNLYQSIMDSTGGWLRPQKLGSNISTASNETSATISSDGNMLIFASDRPGGEGGIDLYIVRKLPNGEWGLARNMGPVINTKYDEEGPFLHPDGSSLFYSSKGHTSIGGYDLFLSEQQDDSSWSEPHNLGYPINTTGDDAYYILSSDGKRAYYSSYKEGGAGGMDLYMMNLISLPERSAAVVKGVVRISGTDIIPTDITITVSDVQTGAVIGVYKPNKSTGRYTLILKHGKNYKITCEAENCEFRENIICVPKNSSFFELNTPIYLDPIGTIK
ncbi:MAG: hypothetical protein ABIJ16_08565 [Bacteroidota bacterium]